MEINKETFTIQDLKQLLKEAFDFDYEKHKGKVKFFPLTIVEWHKSDIFRDKLSLDNIKRNILEWRRPFDDIGRYFSRQKSFVVFFRRTETIKLLESYDVSLDVLLVYLFRVMFHELQHYYQEILDDWDDITLFSYQICLFVLQYKPQDYRDYHNVYWQEIDANLYSVERVYEFLKSKSMLTERTEKILQAYKNQYQFDSNNFDEHLFLIDIHEIIQEHPEINIEDHGFISLFYDDSHRFRSIDAILKFADEAEVDEELLNIFFSSKDFLDSLNFNILSSENKQVIMNAIEYALEIEINRRKNNKELLQNRQITAKQYLEADARICSKIAYFNKKIAEFKRLMGIPVMNCNTDEEKRR